MFGYWGWGSSTVQLVESVDAVEKQRGFGASVFVDIRAHRSGRAKGFVKEAFKDTVGADRYRWMSDLGNQAVLSGSTSRKGIQIRSPKATVQLLELAQQLREKNRHLLYFCACEYPRFCHRYTVAKLLLKSAARQQVSLEVVEWPGNEPSSAPLDIGIRAQKNAHAKRLPLDCVEPLWKFAGLPFGATVLVARAAKQGIVPVAPVRFAPGGWYLPILQADKMEIPPTPRAIAIWRESRGYNALLAAPKSPTKVPR